VLAIVLAACTSSENGPPTAPGDADPAAAGKPAGITTTRLPTLGGAGAANAINDDGSVVGSAVNGSGTRVAVRWTRSASRWTIAVLSSQTGSAHGINSEGTVVGVSAGFATVWAAGGQTVLGPFPAVATGINSAGTVVGYRTDVPKAVYWTASATGWNAGQDLPTTASGTCNGISAEYSAAWAIGDDGTVVGDGCHLDGEDVALRWTAQTPEGPWAAPEAVATAAPALRGAAFALSAAGNVAGTMDFQAACCGSFEPVVWSASGSVTRLGVLTGHARGINEAGQVVGFYQASINRSPRPFLWTPGIGIRELASGGEANDINDRVAPGMPVLAVGTTQLSRGGAPVVWTIAAP
jgi:uncharacterized membrane protein